MTNLRYEQIPIKENNDPLVDLSAYPFVLDPIYFAQGLAETDKLYTRKAIAEKLVVLQEGLLKGHRFKIWDSWRPRDVQANIYRKYWNEMKVAHPEWSEERLAHEVGVFVTAPDTPGRIPPHTTGGAIDLTLIDVQTGREMDMGTVFDHFGPEASIFHFEYPGRDPVVRHNRRLLRDAMIEGGFSVDHDEWWHFDFGNQKWAVETGRSVAFYGEARLG